LGGVENRRVVRCGRRMGGGIRGERGRAVVGGTRVGMGRVGWEEGEWGGEVWGEVKEMCGWRGGEAGDARGGIRGEGGGKM